MAGSVLGYRVYRLRRLIAVCLGLLGLGVVAGVWLVPGDLALRITFGLGLFSLLAMAHLAIIVIWPRDAAEPLVSALGFAVVLPLAMAALNHLATTPAEKLTALALSLVALPVVWAFVIRMLGWLMLKPLDLLRRRDVPLRVVARLPMPMDAARACFFAGPHRKRRDAVTGPVEWDGFFTETNTRRYVDAASGAISTTTFANRMRILEETETAQGVMAQIVDEAGTVLGTVVMHQTLAAVGGATRMERRYSIGQVTIAEVFTGWLADLQQDSITALVDEAMGQPPRAICEEPKDSLPNAVNRWFRWNEPAPGG